MLAEKNLYIQSAYEQLQVISQDKQKRLEYEAREKAIRDYNQLMREATTKGYEQGIQQKLMNLIEKRMKKNKTIEEIAEDLDESIETITPLYYQLKETIFVK